MALDLQRHVAQTTVAEENGSLMPPFKGAVFFNNVTFICPY
jgi:hypothetical protein